MSQPTSQSAPSSPQATSSSASAEAAAASATVPATSSTPASSDGTLDPTQFFPSLSALLRTLEQTVRQWLEQPHPWPLPALQKAQLASLLDDLRRQIELLATEHPLLLIVLMGGTGVGKSTLLNALAGSPIAPADIRRPTTREPVVYLHHSVRPERLDPALRLCRLVPHDREPLRYKVLVDTPDLDSNVPEHRDKLVRILPIADIVLYVGSQEKYHDQLGWELFRQHRHRRAFAFVLNKWDRCLTEEGYGRRPDEDWLRDLQAEGFQRPRLFRTAANLWLQAYQHQEGGSPPHLPPDEQFRQLQEWLEWGLTRREIEAIKARGIEQLLETLTQTLRQFMPTDLEPSLPALRREWERQVQTAAEQQANVLLRMVEQYRTEIEHYFRNCEHRGFRGFMAAYLWATQWFRESGSRFRHPWRSAWSALSSTETAEASQVPKELATFLQQAWGWNYSSAATPQAQPLRELPQRLLLTAQQLGLPGPLFQQALDAATPSTPLERDLQQTLLQAVRQVETEFHQSGGPRRLLRLLLVLIANYAPELAFLATAATLLWQFIVWQQVPGLFQLALVLLVPLLVVVTLHLLLNLLFPLKWQGLRYRIAQRLQQLLHEQIRTHWLAVLDNVLRKVQQERQRLEELIQEIGRIHDWQCRHATQAEIAQLYAS